MPYHQHHQHQQEHRHQQVQQHKHPHDAIFLPNGDRGLFARTRRVPRDAWVLRAAADANAASWRCDGHHRCLGHFFGTVHGRIRMRTAFRKLYFRCFRKAFAPGGRQAARALRAWAGDFSAA